MPKHRIESKTTEHGNLRLRCVQGAPQSSGTDGAEIERMEDPRSHVARTVEGPPKGNNKDAKQTLLAHGPGSLHKNQGQARRTCQHLRRHGPRRAARTASVARTAAAARSAGAVGLRRTSIDYSTAVVAVAATAAAARAHTENTETTTPNQPKPLRENQTKPNQPNVESELPHKTHTIRRSALALDI